MIVHAPDLRYLFNFQEKAKIHEVTWYSLNLPGLPKLTVLMKALLTEGLLPVTDFRFIASFTRTLSADC
jgi:hypothetical protein